MSAEGGARVEREPALRLIIAYKFGRAVVSALAGLGLLGLSLSREGPALLAYVEQLRDHATSGLAVRVAGLVLNALQAEHVVVVIAALFLDGTVLVIEGLALWRGWAWGAWLVVGAAMLLLPFEVDALLHKVSAVRIIVLVLNMAIAGYLIVRTMRRAQPRVL